MKKKIPYIIASTLILLGFLIYHHIKPNVLILDTCSNCAPNEDSAQNIDFRLSFLPEKDTLQPVQVDLLNRYSLTAKVVSFDMDSSNDSYLSAASVKFKIFEPTICSKYEIQHIDYEKNNDDIVIRLIIAPNPSGRESETIIKKNVDFRYSNSIYVEVTGVDGLDHLNTMPYNEFISQDSGRKFIPPDICQAVIRRGTN